MKVGIFSTDRFYSKSVLNGEVPRGAKPIEIPQKLLFYEVVPLFVSYKIPSRFSESIGYEVIVDYPKREIKGILVCETGGCKELIKPGEEKIKKKLAVVFLDTKDDIDIEKLSEIESEIKELFEKSLEEIEASAERKRYLSGVIVATGAGDNLIPFSVYKSSEVIPAFRNINVEEEEKYKPDITLAVVKTDGGVFISTKPEIRVYGENVATFANRVERIKEEIGEDKKVRFVLIPVPLLAGTNLKYYPFIPLAVSGNQIFTFDASKVRKTLYLQLRAINEALSQVSKGERVKVKDLAGNNKSLEKRLEGFEDALSPLETEEALEILEKLKKAFEKTFNILNSPYGGVLVSAKDLNLPEEGINWSEVFSSLRDFENALRGLLKDYEVHLLPLERFLRKKLETGEGITYSVQVGEERESRIYPEGERFDLVHLRPERVFERIIRSALIKIGVYNDLKEKIYTLAQSFDLNLKTPPETFVIRYLGEQFLIEELTKISSKPSRNWKDYLLGSYIGKNISKPKEGDIELEDFDFSGQVETKTLEDDELAILESEIFGDENEKSEDNLDDLDLLL